MSDRMLSAPLALHDVDDVEALVALALDDQLRRFGAVLKPLDREDALAYLVALAFELSLRYDPGRGWSFSKYLYNVAKLRLVDWYRLRFGDTRRRDAPELPLSLDAGSAHLDGAAVTEGGDLGARLESALGGGTLDLATDRDPDLIGALSGRSRRPAWLGPSPGEEGSQRAA